MTFKMEERCDGCPAEPGARAAPGPWIAHLIRLANLVEAGCSFRLDELTIEEWEGLVVLRQEQAQRHPAAPK